MERYGEEIWLEATQAAPCYTEKKADTVSTGGE